MIAVELRGRLGNQLFQYAFAMAASSRLGTDFAFYVPNAAAPDGEELSRYFTLAGRKLALIDDPGYPRRWIDNQDYDRPEDVLEGLTDRTSYGGYFQSPRFFADVEREVRRAFEIRPDLDRAFRDRFANLLAEPYVCCQVRRAADYRTLLGGSQLPLEYYRQGLAMVSPPPGTLIVFVADELEEVSGALSSIPGARFESNEPIVDFQLILHAQAAVISNSTFAWWAAWLAGPSRLVVAPRYWLGWHHQTGWHRRPAPTAHHARARRSWEYPHAILPSDWLQVPIRRGLRDCLRPRSIKSSSALVAHNLLASFDERRRR
jgi:Glycosyl transferase family 11